MFSRSRIPVSVILKVSVFFLLSSVARAHEFWIEPIIPSASAEVKISAHVKVGQNFKGDAQYYIPSEIKAALITDSEGAVNVNRVIGDFPIFDQAPRKPGLQILSYFSTPTQLTYSEPGIFETFLRTQGLDWVLETHRQRGLPPVGFREAFSRCAKALVKRGDGSGKDERIGLPFEIVAQEDPYDIKAGSIHNLPVRLFWQGQPHAWAQIKVFEKFGAVVTESKVRTDKNGFANIPVSEGKSYLLSAVHMIAGEKVSGVAWQSYWASLTFGVGTMS